MAPPPPPPRGPAASLPPSRASPTGLWRVTVRETDAVVGDRIRRAATPGAKMIGLLGRASLEPGEGLLIERTWSIHMFFMRFAIDCVYLDAGLRIAKIAPRVPPFAMSWSGLPPAAHTLELPAGQTAACGLEVGQTLLFAPRRAPTSGDRETGL